MTWETISAQDVHATSLRLRGEDVLVRTMAAETVRASGLHVPHAATEKLLGHVFYGVIVATGPGRMVERGPRAGEHVAPAWRSGDHVCFRQGFGPCLELAEGTHYVIGRGNSDHGHGIVATWEPGHVHCWHEAPLPISNGALERLASEEPSLGDAEIEAFRVLALNELARRMGRCPVACSCGLTDQVVDTCLPTCLDCPPGPRVAEAHVGVKVQDVQALPGPSEFERQQGAGGPGWRVVATAPVEDADQAAWEASRKSTLIPKTT